jgi:ubiquinone/menaquinone biosynthesis C-methylase UbiE
MVTPPGRLTGVVEWMDRPGVDPAELTQTLRDLARLNRTFGATRLLFTHLYPFFSSLEPPIVILDVGTGYADIPRAVVQWARRRGLAIQVDAVDRHGGILGQATQACASYPEIRLREANALSLPYADRSVDVAIASQVLHHMEGEELVQFLRELRRVARFGVVVNDLRRGAWPLLATWTTLHLVSSSPLIRHDGPMSIRRGFLQAELLALAKAAGWTTPQVFRRAFFRLALTERIA